MSDPTTMIAAKGLEVAGKATEGILQRLLGPAADEIGEMLRDKVKAYRAKNLERVLSATQAQLASSGQEPQPVPTRLLLPIIEGASMEDCEELSERWAGLLASAATTEGLSRFHPSFPAILSEITAAEASLLDRLLSQGGEAQWAAYRAAAITDFALTDDLVDMFHGNLFRLGLWRNVSKGGGQPLVTLSPFGKLFLQAARGYTAAA